MQNVASFCNLFQSFNLVQSCSAMFRVVQWILKAVKNVQWTRLNFFCLKKMFNHFARALLVKFQMSRNMTDSFSKTHGFDCHFGIIKEAKLVEVIRFYRIALIRSCYFCVPF